MPRTVNFDLKNNGFHSSIYFCDRHGKDSYSEIGHTAFLEKLAEDPAEHILFYIHGFSSLPEAPIFEQTQELQNHLNTLAPTGSIKVVPLIWPSDDDFGIIKDYFDDQISADGSGFAFARGFKWLTDSPISKDSSGKGFSLMAHSMGSKVLQSILEKSAKHFYKRGFPSLFQNIFLVAPDLENEVLETGHRDMWIPLVTRNVVVYYAVDDWALFGSIVANASKAGISKRLGQSGPADMIRTPSNVFALDCNSFNNSYDHPVGHNYFTSTNGEESESPGEKLEPGLVVKHMHRTLQKGEVAIFPGKRHCVLDDALVSEKVPRS
ncbi:MAG: alpha/beta hydrolase [Cyanobacteria bacterium P01_C01_bin.89]